MLLVGFYMKLLPFPITGILSDFSLHRSCVCATISVSSDVQLTGCVRKALFPLTLSIASDSSSLSSVKIPEPWASREM